MDAAYYTTNISSSILHWELLRSSSKTVANTQSNREVGPRVWWQVNFSIPHGSVSYILSLWFLSGQTVSEAVIWQTRLISVHHQRMSNSYNSFSLTISNLAGWFALPCCQHVCRLYCTEGKNRSQVCYSPFLWAVLRCLLIIAKE